MKEVPNNAFTNGMLPVLTLDEWLSEGQKRFGKEKLNWKFICPSCGHIASGSDWINAGASQNAIAFSCVGRATGAKETIMTKNKGPCNYTGGGLFKLNPQPIKFEDGTVCNFFEFAPTDFPGDTK